MEKYYLPKLYNQYLSATEDYSFTRKNFVKWIINNHKILIEYKNLLKELDIFDFGECIEIDKGIYDSISNGDIEVASRFQDDKNNYMIINGILYVARYSSLQKSDKTRILTHNPYDESYFKYFKDIHNNGLQSISLGAYGSIADANYRKKYNLMEKLSKELNDDYEFDYEIINGNYFISINSSRKIKRKLRTF